MKSLTVVRYSTARSALLKLARMARNTWSLGNPMSTMLSIAPCKPSPDRKVPGSPIEVTESEVLRDEIVSSWVAWRGAVAGTEGSV